MRWPGALLVLIAFLYSIGCNRALENRHAPVEWKTAFWFWNGGDAGAGVVPGPVDTLYVQAGSIAAGGQ